MSKYWSVERSKRLLRGALAGTLATAAMSVVLVAAKKAGALGRMPPKAISDKALDKAGLSPAIPEQGKRAIAIAAHFCFGATCGALFELGYSRLPRKRRKQLPTSVWGAAFGTMVWGLSYAGWVPALHILPPPTRDRKDRQTTMLLAHWVYGTVLGSACNHPQA